MKNYLEQDFEEHIEEQLVNNGYGSLEPTLYDKSLCLIPTQIIEFIQYTQPKTFEKLESEARVNVVIQRLESFALASSGDFTKGVAVMGISPENEDKMTKEMSYLQQGEFINSNDKAIMVAEGLAKF